MGANRAVLLVMVSFLLIEIWKLYLVGEQKLQRQWITSLLLQSWGRANSEICWWHKSTYRTLQGDASQTKHLVYIIFPAEMWVCTFITFLRRNFLWKMWNLIYYVPIRNERGGCQCTTCWYYPSNWNFQRFTFP